MQQVHAALLVVLDFVCMHFEQFLNRVLVVDEHGECFAVSNHQFIFFLIK